MSAKEAISVRDAWNRVVTKYREVCVFRRESRFEESERVLKEELPDIIAAWAMASPEPIATKRAELEAMFAAERKRVDEVLQVRRLINNQTTEQFIPVARTLPAEDAKLLFTEQVHTLPPTGQLESKGAARSVTSLTPESFSVPITADPIGLPLPPALVSRRKPNFNLARA